MQTNRQMQFNLGTFNIPTVVGLLTIIGMLWNFSTTKAEFETKVSQRLATNEAEIAGIKTDTAAQFAGLNAAVSGLPNILYRTQALESANQATNARIDRQNDAIGGIRDGISSLSTDLKVLTQRLELVVPFKKSDLYIDQFDTRPRRMSIPRNFRENQK